MTDLSASAADHAGPGMNPNNFDEFEAQLEELFDRADVLMIKEKNYPEAVSILKNYLTYFCF